MTTDAFERLRAANPVSTPPSAGPPPMFDETPRSRAWRVRLVVVAAVIIALVGVPALALGFDIIDFGSSPPASPRVVRDFASLSKGAPRGMDPGVIAEQARQLTADGHTLWIAPTRSGGLCYEWDGGSGGCDRLGTVPLSVTWLGRPALEAPPTHAPPRSSPAVEGFAHARWVDSIDIRLDNGTTIAPKLTWISLPIDSGFFRYVAPEGRGIVEVIGLRDGRAVIDEQLGRQIRPHPYARLAQRELLGEVATTGGPVRLWAAPTETDGRCVWLAFGAEERAIGRCLPEGYEGQAALALSLEELGGNPILVGECGYAAVELIGADRASREVDCRDGILLAKLDENELRGTAQAIDAAGNPLPHSLIEVAALQR